MSHAPASMKGGRPGRPGRPAQQPTAETALAVLAARRESERRRLAALRQGAVSEGGGNFSMVLRGPDAEALAKICKRDGCTRSDAVRAALAAYVAGHRKAKP